MFHKYWGKFILWFLKKTNFGGLDPQKSSSRAQIWRALWMQDSNNFENPIAHDHITYRWICPLSFSYTTTPYLEGSSTFATWKYESSKSWCIFFPVWSWRRHQLCWKSKSQIPFAAILLTYPEIYVHDRMPEAMT